MSFFMYKGESLKEASIRLGVSERTVSRRKAEAIKDGTFKTIDKEEASKTPPKRSKTVKRRTPKVAPVETPEVAPTPAPVEPEPAPKAPAQYTCIVTEDSAVVYDITDGSNRAFEANTPEYTRIREQVIKKDWNFDWLFAFNRAIQDNVLNFTNPEGGTLTISKDGVLLNDVAVEPELSVFLIGKFEDGTLTEKNKFVQFLLKLANNPKQEMQEELPAFLRFNDIEIANDGDVLAFKRVNANLFDCYTGTINNSPGKVVTMERDKVDANRERTCSAGLHICSKHYLPSYSGAKLVKVKVNPADFVAIPTDYENAKARVCRYEVIEELDLEAVLSEM